MTSAEIVGATGRGTTVGNGIGDGVAAGTGVGVGIGVWIGVGIGVSFEDGSTAGTVRTIAGIGVAESLTILTGTPPTEVKLVSSPMAARIERKRISFLQPKADYCSYVKELKDIIKRLNFLVKMKTAETAEVIPAGWTGTIEGVAHLLRL